MNKKTSNKNRQILRVCKGKKHIPSLMSCALLTSNAHIAQTNKQNKTKDRTKKQRNQNSARLKQNGNLIFINCLLFITIVDSQ